LWDQSLGLSDFFTEFDFRRTIDRRPLIDVGGRAMRVQTANLAQLISGQPVVVLESGAVSPLENWDPVFDRIASIAPVIAYDRRGRGKSEFDGEVPTLKHVTGSLHLLLAQLKAPPPYILVGHSYGGVLIRAFAQSFPTEAAGFVYLDAPAVDITNAEIDAVSIGHYVHHDDPALAVQVIQHVLEAASTPPGK